MKFTYSPVMVLSRANCRLLTSVLVSLFAMVILSNSAVAQGSPVANLRETDAPGVLIVIFSPEVEPSNRTAAQGVVWKKFIERLRKKKVTSMEVVNEVAVNDAADRARALDLAMAEQNRYTIWLQFSAITDAAETSRTKVAAPERLTLKYQVYPPASNRVISQGEVEEQRSPQGQFQTANNEKVFRDNSGRVVNARPNVRLPDGSTTAGPAIMDIDSLSKIGEDVADRLLSAVKKDTSGRKP
ncbi:MAG: hypothetical protein IPM50_09470 [Acidobacteriota bacterium]|nr:MAG: hypothetical protein IPM50_09470 [Acidobacteriota bacterium]